MSLRDSQMPSLHKPLWHVCMDEIQGEMRKPELREEDREWEKRKEEAGGRETGEADKEREF